MCCKRQGSLKTLNHVVLLKLESEIRKLSYCSNFGHRSSWQSINSLQLYGSVVASVHVHVPQCLY